MAKGADFERTICKRLSEWWIPGRDDIFWRSSNSGGRATIRGRVGKSTFGHYGDIAATDPIGAPLLDIAAMEIKRGYNAADFHALLDRPRKAAQQLWEQWIQQAVASCVGSGSYSWIIIARRDNKDPIIVMENHLWHLLKDHAKRSPLPIFKLACKIRYRHLVKKEKVKVKIKGKMKTRNSNQFEFEVHLHNLVGLRFDEFLEVFDRSAFLKVSKLV